MRLNSNEVKKNPLLTQFAAKKTTRNVDTGKEGLRMCVCVGLGLLLNISLCFLMCMLWDPFKMHAIYSILTLTLPVTACMSSAVCRAHEPKTNNNKKPNINETHTTTTTDEGKKYKQTVTQAATSSLTKRKWKWKNGTKRTKNNVHWN